MSSLSALKEQAISFFQSGQYDLAAASCNKYLKISDHDVELWQIYAAINAELSNNDLVLECCYKILSLKPNDAPSHNNLAIALQRESKILSSKFLASRVSPFSCSRVAYIRLAST